MGRAGESESTAEARGHTAPIPRGPEDPTGKMPTKKTPVKKTQKRRKRKIQIELPESLVRSIDREVRRSAASGQSTSRAALMRELLGLGVVRRSAADSEDAASRSDVREALLKEAAALAREAAAHEASGSRRAASRLYLAASSREIEAISYMAQEDETSLKSALILAIHYMKKGTGYSRLPEYHASVRASDVV